MEVSSVFRSDEPRHSLFTSKLSEYREHNKKKIGFVVYTKRDEYFSRGEKKNDSKARMLSGYILPTVLLSVLLDGC